MALQLLQTSNRHPTNHTIVHDILNMSSAYNNDRGEGRNVARRATPQRAFCVYDITMTQFPV